MKSTINTNLVPQFSDDSLQFLANNNKEIKTNNHNWEKKKRGRPPKSKSPSKITEGSNEKENRHLNKSNEKDEDDEDYFSHENKFNANEKEQTNERLPITIDESNKKEFCLLTKNSKGHVQTKTTLITGKNTPTIIQRLDYDNTKLQDNSKEAKERVLPQPLMVNRKNQNESINAIFNPPILKLSDIKNILSQSQFSSLENFYKLDKFNYEKESKFVLLRQYMMNRFPDNKLIDLLILYLLNYGTENKYPDVCSLNKNIDLPPYLNVFTNLKIKKLEINHFFLKSKKFFGSINMNKNQEPDNKLNHCQKSPDRSDKIKSNSAGLGTCKAAKDSVRTPLLECITSNSDLNNNKKIPSDTKFFSNSKSNSNSNSIEFIEVDGQVKKDKKTDEIIDGYNSSNEILINNLNVLDSKIQNNIVNMVDDIKIENSDSDSVKETFNLYENLNFNNSYQFQPYNPYYCPPTPNANRKTNFPNNSYAPYHPFGMPLMNNYPYPIMTNGFMNFYHQNMNMYNRLENNKMHSYLNFPKGYNLNNGNIPSYVGNRDQDNKILNNKRKRDRTNRSHSECTDRKKGRIDLEEDEILISNLVERKIQNKDNKSQSRAPIIIDIEEKKVIPVEEKKVIPVEEKKVIPVEEKKVVPVEEKKVVQLVVHESIPAQNTNEEKKELFEKENTKLVYNQDLIFDDPTDFNFPKTPSFHVYDRDVMYDYNNSPNYESLFTIDPDKDKDKDKDKYKDMYKDKDKYKDMYKDIDKPRENGIRNFNTNPFQMDLTDCGTTHTISDENEGLICSNIKSNLKIPQKKDLYSSGVFASLSYPPISKSSGKKDIALNNLSQTRNQSKNENQSCESIINLEKTDEEKKNFFDRILKIVSHPDKQELIKLEGMIPKGSLDELINIFITKKAKPNLDKKIFLYENCDSNYYLKFTSEHSFRCVKTKKKIS